MKLLSQIIVLIFIFAVSACSSQDPQHTASARAAYGNDLPEFQFNTKQNQKRKKVQVKEAKRKKTGSEGSYFHARPY